MAPMTKGLGRYFKVKCQDPECSFKQKLQRTSTAWGDLGKELRKFLKTVESDYPSFDLGVMNEDIEWALGFLFYLRDPAQTEADVLAEILEETAKENYTSHIYVDDAGNVTRADTLVDSGVSLTSDIDTVIRLARDIRIFFSMGYTESQFKTFAAGDDAIAGVSHADENFAKTFAEESNLQFDGGLTLDDVKVFDRAKFQVHRFQPVYPPYLCLTSTSGLRGREIDTRLADGDLVIDHAQGLTHRNFYGTTSAPTFLKFHWNWQDLPIRDVNGTLKTRLNPEGTVNSIKKDIAGNLGTIVDNPFNFNMVNGALHRIILLYQYSLLGYLEVGTKLLLELLATPADDRFGLQFFPEVGWWRRSGEWTDPKRHPHIRGIIETVEAFADMARMLYLRRPDGGFDAWRLKEILRFESNVHPDLWGSDLGKMVEYILGSPLGRALSIEKKDFFHWTDIESGAEVRAKFFAYKQHFMTNLRNGVLGSAEYAIDIGDRRHALHMATTGVVRRDVREIFKA